MKIYGLVGYPLGHSFSRNYFTEKFANNNIADSVYQNFSIENIEMFAEIVKNPEICGLNVTIPYKEQVMKFLDEVNPTAKEVGAVNTVKFIRNGNKTTLCGYNTDIYGFEESLKPLLKSHHTKALILGTGGASKAIKFVLKKLNIDFVSASIDELKEKEIRYEDINQEVIENHTVIINATPLGTFPKVDTCANIPYQYIGNQHILFDLVYNPEETKFMRLGRENGATTINGLKMLHLQAEKAWEIWNM